MEQTHTKQVRQKGYISVEAPREPLRRNLMMIVAHIIWESATGILTKWFT